MNEEWMIDAEFAEEAQWQQRVHEALAKYTTGDVVAEIRDTLNQWIIETLDGEEATPLQLITDEDILALVEVIDDNEKQVNSEALTLAQAKGIYKYLEWPYVGEREIEDWIVAYVKAFSGQELQPSTPHTPLGEEPWRRIVKHITQTCIDNAEVA